VPYYDYLCKNCGPFTQVRPMSECDLESECPECGEEAPRAILRAPNFAAMSSERRLAFATNERSAVSPLALSRAQSKAHGSGCACCSSGAASKRPSNKRREGAAKGFPGKRPWMISH
jgi:putative FmdB family regulatory protein